MNYVRNVFDWYFSRNSLPYWGVLLLDCLIALFAGYVGNYLDYGGIEFAQRFWHLTWGNLCCIVCFVVGFRLFHTYTGILRYSSLIDLERIGGAVTVGTILSYLLGKFFSMTGMTLVEFHHLEGLVGMFVCTILLMWVERMAVRGAFDSIRQGDATPVAIYGTKAGGLSLAHSITGSHEKKYILRAFISDNSDIRNSYILGKPVLFNGPDLVEDLKKQRVRAFLVSPKKNTLFRNNNKLIDDLTAVGIQILMMPAAEVWDGKSDLSHNRLHPVEIEDLLPRDEIKVDMDAIGSMLTGRRILITGAAGSIGSEMVRQIAPYKPAELILVDQAETPMHDMRLLMARRFSDIQNETIVCSITDATQMEAIFAIHRPEYVFHAAAYKHVPMMEDNPAQAVRNNVRGTRIIADLAVKYGTKKFVMISTDKAVNPTNVMGCSKRICEIYCQSLSAAQTTCQFVTTRFGNVLGSNGSVIPIFKEQIRKGGPITVTHPDIIRYFMLIPEACKLVLEAGTMGKGGEIFVFDMGKPVKIVDLAKRMIALSGAQDIEIKYTGLRDGEKLYEEVLNDAEGAVPTQNPKIKVAKVREYDYETACRNEDELMKISYSQDDMEIVRKMKEIVPEYKSRVSKYEVLDN